MKKILNAKIPLPYSLFLVCTVMFGTFAATNSYYHLVESARSVMEAKTVEPESATNCSFVQVRMDGYRYIKPLVYVDYRCESHRLLPIKHRLQGIIDRNGREGAKISVYVRELSSGDFLCVNENERYANQNLVKLPLLMAYLKKIEDAKLDLTDKVSLPSRSENDKQSPSAAPQSYKDLLSRMIVEDDSLATKTLFKNLDTASWYKLLSDLSLERPISSVTDANIVLSVKDYSVFLRALYNAGFLSIKFSEYAIELLERSNHRGQIGKGLPPEQKFVNLSSKGLSDELKSISETSIIYAGSSSYLLTIIAQGPKNEQSLDMLVNEISKEVYLSMKKIST